MTLAAVEEESKNAFVSKFRQAMRIGSRDECARLVRSNEVFAVEFIIEDCESISGGGSDALEEEINALRQAWKQGFRTEFVDRVYEYFSLIKPDARTARQKLSVRYRLVWKEFGSTQAAKKTTEYARLGLEFKGLAMGFEDLGDAYMASQAWVNYGIAFDERLNGKKADLHRACEGYGKGVAARDLIELRDLFYNQTKERYQALVHGGYSSEEPGGPAGASTEPVASSPSVPVATTFEVLETIDEVRRPNYTADSIYGIWDALRLQGKDSKAEFLSLTESSMKVIRVSAAKAVVDLDGDGRGDVDLPLKGKPTPVRVTIGSGADERDWAFLAVIGSDQDSYQGTRFNLAPDDNQMSIFVAPAGCLVGTIGGTAVRILDDNMDGVYGGPPLSGGTSASSRAVSRRTSIA